MTNISNQRWQSQNTGTQLSTPKQDLLIISFLTAFWFGVFVIFKTNDNQGIFSITFNWSDCFTIFIWVAMQRVRERKEDMIRIQRKGKMYRLVWWIKQNMEVWNFSGFMSIGHSRKGVGVDPDENNDSSHTQLGTSFLNFLFKKYGYIQELG